MSHNQFGRGSLGRKATLSIHSVASCNRRFTFCVQLGQATCIFSTRTPRHVVTFAEHLQISGVQAVGRAVQARLRALVENRGTAAWLVAGGGQIHVNGGT